MRALIEEGLSCFKIFTIIVFGVPAFPFPFPFRYAPCKYENMVNTSKHYTLLLQTDLHFQLTPVGHSSSGRKRSAWWDCIGQGCMVWHCRQESEMTLIL